MDLVEIRTKIGTIKTDLKKFAFARNVSVVFTLADGIIPMIYDKDSVSKTFLIIGMFGTLLASTHYSQEIGNAKKELECLEQEEIKEISKVLKKIEQKDIPEEEKVKLMELTNKITK